MVFKSRSAPSLFDYDDDDDMTETTATTNYTWNTRSHASTDASLSSLSPAQNERRQRKPNRKRRARGKANKSTASLGQFLADDRSSNRPTLSRENSFRPTNSVAVADFHRMDSLDVSLASWAQRTATERGGESSTKALTKRKSTRPGPPQRQGSVTKFVEARLNTWVRNIETIGLILIGEA